MQRHLLWKVSVVIRLLILILYNMTKIQIMQVYWDGWVHGVLHTWYRYIDDLVFWDAVEFVSFSSRTPMSNVVFNFNSHFWFCSRWALFVWTYPLLLFKHYNNNNNNNNYIYHALINALSAHMIHIKIHMIWYSIHM